MYHSIVYDILYTKCMHYVYAYEFLFQKNLLNKANFWQKDEFRSSSKNVIWKKTSECKHIYSSSKVGYSQFWAERFIELQ